MPGRSESRGRLAAAEDEERETGQSEEDEIGRHDVAEDLFVGAAQRDHNGDDPLQRDRDDRHMRLRADAADAAEEKAVRGHRVVDARRGEHALAEKAERRNGDARGDELRAALAEGQAHHRRCRRGRVRQSSRAQRADADVRHTDVDRDHADDSGQQSDDDPVFRLAEERLGAVLGEQGQQRGPGHAVKLTPIFPNGKGRPDYV